jgi:hypothetical protein
MGGVDDLSFMVPDHRQQRLRLVFQDSAAMHRDAGWLVNTQQIILSVQEIVWVQHGVFHLKQFPLLSSQKKPGGCRVENFNAMP